MLNNFLNSLSRTTLAVGAIALGIMFIIANDPPRTVCDAQLKVFRKDQTSFLFLDKEDKQKSKIDFEPFLDQCRRINSPGGCSDFFRKMRILNQELATLPSDCKKTVSGDAPVKRALWEGLELMVRIAWGSKPPEGLAEKLSWFGPADLMLYCALRSRVKDYYGQSQWENYQERMFKELPEVQKLTRNQAWEKMLLSINCAQAY